MLISVLVISTALPLSAQSDHLFIENSAGKDIIFENSEYNVLLKPQVKDKDHNKRRDIYINKNKYQLQYTAENLISIFLNDTIIATANDGNITIMKRVYNLAFTSDTHFSYALDSITVLDCYQKKTADEKRCAEIIATRISIIDFEILLACTLDKVNRQTAEETKSEATVQGYKALRMGALFVAVVFTAIIAIVTNQ